jgi:hypothetical protein
LVNLNRLETLESGVPDLGLRACWIDHYDNRVRVDIDHKRGDEMIFESLFWACRSVEYHARQFKKVNGVCFVSDIRQIFSGSYVSADDETAKIFHVGLLSLAQFDFQRDYIFTLVDSFIASPILLTIESQVDTITGLAGLWDALESMDMPTAK